MGFAGRAEGSMDAANLFKPALVRGQLRCIGATTLEDYRSYVEKDAAFERRFQQVGRGRHLAMHNLDPECMNFSLQ
jgi:ATP-dependent Clp protease ATP-binding subunit ClpA